ncbi:MAG: metalloregulator ArsR/SmtB family transcription factor [Acidimicrobiales bacterium]
MDLALKAIADPKRREILRLVWNHELAATDIADHFGDVTRSAISQHLGVLRQANLICERRAGTRRLYLANVDQMTQLRTFLDQYWSGGLDRLKTAAEAAQRKKDRHHG